MPRSDERRIISDSLAPPILLVAPLIQFLRFNSYPLLRVDSLLLVAGLVLLGLGIGQILHRGPYIVRWAALSLLLLAVVDLSGKLAAVSSALMITAVAALLVRLLWEHAATIIMATGLAFLLSVLIIPQQETVGTEYADNPELQADRSLPPVLHLVLDEHAGLEGLPDEQLREDVADFFTGRGFRVFSRAYSHHWDSYNSIPNLLNFSSDSIDAGFIADFEFSPAVGEQHHVGSNRYFAALAALGYRIRVYQMPYLDFCRSEPLAIASCYTYPTNTVWYLPHLPVGVPARARMLLAYFLSKQSYLFQRFADLYRGPLDGWLASVGVQLPAWDWSGDRVIAPFSLVGDRVIADLGSEARGELVFAHFILPHYPYQYDADCRPHSQVRDRLDRWSPNAPPPQSNTDESRRRRYELYADQVRCSLSELGDLLDTLEARVDLDSAIVIVQGDHGSRIGLREPRQHVYDRLTRQDLLDGYSSLFAIAGPGVAGGVDSTLIPIQRLLGAFVESGFEWSDTPDPPTPFVWIMDVDTREMRREPYPGPPTGSEPGKTRDSEDPG